MNPYGVTQRAKQLSQAFAAIRKQARDEAFKRAGNLASGYSEAAADAIYSLKDSK